MGKTKSNRAKEQSRYLVPALDRGLKILEFLAGEPAGAGAAEIAASVKLPKPSVFRMLLTLHNAGYLLKDESAGSYRLSRKMLSLGYSAVDAQSIVEKSLGALKKLRDWRARLDELFDCWRCCH